MALSLSDSTDRVSTMDESTSTENGFDSSREIGATDFQPTLDPMLKTSLPGVESNITGEFLTGLNDSTTTEVMTGDSSLFEDKNTSRVMDFPAFITNETLSGMNENDTFIPTAAEQFSSDISSPLQQITDSAQEDLSTLQTSTYFSHFTLSNITASSFPELENGNLSTNTSLSYSDLYDVTIEYFDVSPDVSPAVFAVKAVTLAALALAGVAGNALVIWSVVRQRHLHRPPFYYLLSLSFTDLSRAAFCLPLVLMTLLQGSVWRHGSSACDLFAFANSFFVLSSSISLLDIAADRHLSLVYPRSYKRRAGGAVNLVVVLLGWILAFLVAFPPVVGVGAYAFQEHEGQCTLRHKFFRHNNDSLGFLLIFTILILLTLITYYRIFVVLRAHRKMKPLEYEPARSSTWTFVGPGANGQAFINWVNGFGGTNLGHLPNLALHAPRSNLARAVNLHVVKNPHVIRLFFLLTLAFNVTWLPYQILSYWRVFRGSEDVNSGFVTAAAWLSYSQVVACPVVYFTSRTSTHHRRTSRADVSPEDKQHELLLESLKRKK